METEVARLKENINSAITQLKIDELKINLQQLKEESLLPDIWKDQTKAANLMQSISKLENMVKPWDALLNSINDIDELIKLGDSELIPEIEKDLSVTSSLFQSLKKQLFFLGPFDDRGVVMVISSGAGGTDAQDWTQILFRMYGRYFEKKGWRFTVVDESPGEEAGLKSVVLDIDGNDYIYGKLKSEHGVHRLVRLSPFNSDNLRQTSFAKVEITPKINTTDKMEIEDKDLKIDVYRSGGHGGQSVNTTDSAVRITYLPTGISVAIQNERSQLQNKETAMNILKSRLRQAQIEQHAKNLVDIKGPNQSAEWGNQIRSYVMHPYKQVKDNRTGYETANIDAVLDGDLDEIIEAYTSSAAYTEIV